jgi:outer membrane protein
MKKLVLLLLFFFLTTSAAYPLDLTLQQCIEMALENNSGFKASKTDLIASAEDVSISHAGLLPSLKLKGTYMLRDKSDVFITRADIFAPGIPPVDVEQSLENQTLYGASLVLDQPLFTGGQLTHALKKSKILGQEAMYRVERQRKLLEFDVKKAFYAALKEQLYRKTLEKTVEAKRERLRVVQELLAEGYVQEDDVLIAETDLAAAELELFKVKNGEDLALSRLKLLTYLKEDGAITLKEKPVTGFLVVSLEEAKEAAVAQREEIKMSMRQIGAAGEDIEIAKSGFYPRTSLQGSVTLQKETTITRPDVWMVTAQVDWPIFEWGKTKSSVKKAESVKQRRQYEHEDLTKAVLFEAEEAWREVKEKEKEVEFREKKLKATESRLKTAAEQYAEKTIKLADLLEREVELTKTYDEYIIAANDLNIAFARLEVATSVTNAEWFTITELYQPDFDGLSRMTKEAFSGKAERARENKSTRDAAIETGRIAREPSVVKSVDAVPTVAPMVSPYPAYVIQASSFRTRQNAREFGRKLMKRIELKGRKITVRKRGNFYKVRIMGFNSKAEAKAFTEKFAIKNSIIVKSVDGH